MSLHSPAAEQFVSLGIDKETQCSSARRAPPIRRRFMSNEAPRPALIEPTIVRHPRRAVCLYKSIQKSSAERKMLLKTRAVGSLLQIEQGTCARDGYVFVIKAPRRPFLSARPPPPWARTGARANTTGQPTQRAMHLPIIATAAETFRP